MMKVWLGMELQYEKEILEFLWRSGICSFPRFRCTEQTFGSTEEHEEMDFEFDCQRSRGVYAVSLVTDADTWRSSSLPSYLNMKWQ